MDFAELCPDVNRELLIFTRVARLVCARESSARDSRGGIIYRVKGENAREKGEKRPLRSRRARCIISFSVQWALFAKVLKRGIKSNDHLLPEPVAAVVQKGPGKRKEKRRARNSREGVFTDAAIHRSKAKGQKETRENAREGRKLESGEPFYIMRRVSRELHGDEGNKCAMKRRMRETAEVDVTCNLASC